MNVPRLQSIVQMAVQLWERFVDPCGPRSAEENSTLDKSDTGLFYETTNKEKTETNVGITRLNSLPALFSRWYGDASIQHWECQPCCTLVKLSKTAVDEPFTPKIFSPLLGYGSGHCWSANSQCIMEK